MNSLLNLLWTLRMSRIFRQGLSFDDVWLRSGYSDFGRNEVVLQAWLANSIRNACPFVSAPMDRVTEARMAIAIAEIGGIGFIHRYLTIWEQANEARIVKTFGCKVGAAIGVSPGFEKRLTSLLEAGIDVILLDSAHGHTKQMIEAIQKIKNFFPSLPIIAGNVSDYEGALALILAGADALRVGMGPGSICSTRIVSGMGVPQVTAILDCVRAARRFNIPVIADGGIRHPGDAVKALALGASTVMMGSVFASAIESPGPIYLLTANQVPSRFKSVSGQVHALTYQQLEESFPDDVSRIHAGLMLGGTSETLYCFKEYRGMGSEGAMEDGAAANSEEEFHGKDFTNSDALVAEGVEGLVPLRGKLSGILAQYIGGLRSGMYYVGAQSIPQLWRKARWTIGTSASLAESHPHDILVTNAGQSLQ